MWIRLEPMTSRRTGGSFDVEVIVSHLGGVEGRGRGTLVVARMVKGAEGIRLTGGTRSSRTADGYGGGVRLRS